ncbi:hypothetical protein [Pseudomonas aeruginosa]|uniref:hypothetical protein n=1 Tax=Pseudomonas aeruginosa TaxID=287 RepID=UPI001419E156|nr:hypothetical protein [Pseudomonas aeruginosa]HEJ2269684.1 hypothetical protein [Pseudomonas aeruginosa]
MYLETAADDFSSLIGRFFPKNQEMPGGEVKNPPPFSAETAADLIRGLNPIF